MKQKKSAVLNISCPDQEGIVAVVTALLSRLGANIIYLDQHVDRENKLFFMRVEWDLDQFSVDLKDFDNSIKVRLTQLNSGQDEAIIYRQKLKILEKWELANWKLENDQRQRFLNQRFIISSI